MFSVYFVISVDTAEVCYDELETVIHHGEGRCCGIAYRWANIDKGQLRTYLAVQQTETLCGLTELTQKQFVWPQQPDGSSW